MCPVLALAAYLATLSHPSLSSSDRLFLRGCQAKRFHKRLRAELEGMADYLRAHGLVPSDVGAHSIHKGSGTYLSTGTTASPSYPAVWRRMSWSIGNTQDRYLFYNPASDAYCGRILARLDHFSAKFALLPPHVASAADGETFFFTKTCLLIFLAVENITSLGKVLQFCAASLIYHGDFHRRTRLPHHALYVTHSFRNFSEVAQGKTVKAGLVSPVLKPTGLPPHVMTWLNQTKIEDILRDVPTSAAERIGALMEEKGVAAGNCTLEQVRGVMQELVRGVRADLENSTGRPAVSEMGR